MCEKFFFNKLTTAAFQEGVKWFLFCYLFYCIVNRHATGTADY